ncbi:MAG: hypothetical protein GX448_15820 [Planctomycetes bacterium]|nr:hypothetical protein [Planctomycetota bacterium]
MSLMKWMRKNNKKLMAIVVIVLMVAFIGGSSFSFLMRGSGGANKAVAYYGSNQKITHNDRRIAENELKLLEELGAADLLRRQDLRGLLLAELLFSQSRDVAGLMEMARQTIQRNQYRISDKQLKELYENRTVPGDIYWILLREEARSAGIYVSPQDVGQMLGRSMGESYSQMMRSWIGRYGVPEKDILATYGKLIAVLQYVQIISSMENVTASQVRHMASRESETVDAEFLKLEASAFADKHQAPSPEALAQQFDQYKANVPGEVTAANPFGFGYRLPNRVQFDYIALKLSDVAAIIKQPTEEDAEQYYQQNRSRQYTEKVPADPNDPNSPQVDKVKNYIEVADDIMAQLRRQRIVTKAEQILQEARGIADVNLPRAMDNKEPTDEQRKEKAGNYAKIAQDLATRHSIPLYSGTTGLLSAADMRSDKYLRRMYLTNYGYNPVPLPVVLFSLKAFGDEATVLHSASPTQMFTSIGPAKDPMSASSPNVAGQIMLIARVVAVEPDAAPASIDASYSTQTLDLGDPSAQKDKLFSVKEKVIKDLQTLAAWDTTSAKASEFMAMATKDGWDQAIKQFNKVYGEQAKADPNDPNVFRLDRRMGTQRISQADLEVLATQLSNTPSGETYLNEARMESQLADRLYLLAADPNSASQLPKIVEFKPERSYYVIKSLSLQPLYQEQFQKMKGMVIGREEYGQAQSLAVVHLNPANILKRTEFRWAQPADEPAKDKERKESKDAS